MMLLHSTRLEVVMQSRVILPHNELIGQNPRTDVLFDHDTQVIAPTADLPAQPRYAMLL
jgi:hypothetical protein